MSVHHPFPLSFPNYLLLDEHGDVAAFAQPGNRRAMALFTQKEAAHEFLEGDRRALVEQFDEDARLVSRLRQLDREEGFTDAVIDPASPDELGTAVPLKTIIGNLEPEES